MTDWFELGKGCTSASDVQAAIELLSNTFKNFDPSFGFAHISLEDGYLSDAGINACLGDKKSILEILNDRIGEIEDWDSTNFHSPSGDLAELLESVAATINLLKGFLYTPEHIREIDSEIM